MAGSKELVTRFPILFALYLFDYRTHGDDGNFVGLWRQCEKPDRWYAGGGEKPAQCGRITLVLPNVIKNFSGFAPLGAIGAGFRCRSGGARRLTASANG